MHNLPMSREETSIQDRLLAAFPALRTLPPAVIDRIARAATLKRASRGTVMFSRGDPCPDLPFLLSGRVRVLRTTPQGKSIQLYTVLAGETCVVSNGALLGGMPIDATGIADTDVELAALPANVVDDLLANEKPFRAFVFRMLGERMADLMGLVEAVAFDRLDRRIARVLVERGPHVAATHQALADELGVAREMVTRVLRSFADRGWITQQREVVEVRDVEALAAM